MLRITELLCGPNQGPETPSRQKDGSSLPPSAQRPVAIWSMTGGCNLHCLHCYSQSQDRAYADELTTDDGKRLIADMARYRIPVVVLSGGDPLYRGELYTPPGGGHNLGGGWG